MKSENLVIEENAWVGSGWTEFRWAQHLREAKSYVLHRPWLKA